MLKNRWISKNDLIMMMEIANNCISCKAEKDFLTLLEQFLSLVPFDKWIVGELNPKYLFNKLPTQRIKEINFPSEFLDTYLGKNYFEYDILHQRYFQTIEIQHFTELIPQYKQVPDNPMLELYRQYGIKDSFLYGTVDQASGHFINFVLLSDENINDIIRYKIIIGHLIPHLAEAFKRLPPFDLIADRIQLTPVEMEVIKWLKEGKSSWEISIILNRSENTINYHIGNILKKTDSMNRTQAIVKALQNNLITI
jgi:LuxR family transcriptional regulator, quorum-sensing system regulator CviR